MSYASVAATPDGLLQHPRTQTKSLSSPSPQHPESRSHSTPTRNSRTLHTGPGISSQPKKRHDPATSNGTFGGARYEHSPKQDHRPKTESKEDCVYVLTLKMSESIAGPMNQMREEWFPKKLNRTPAHLTLFHALPHSKRELMDDSLQAMATRLKPFQVTSGRAFRMRRGVGIGMGNGSKEAVVLHDGLRDEWLDFLSEQDRGGWRPHWTVMNKENEETRIKEAYEMIDEDLKSDAKDGLAVGLDLWKYDRGNWEWTKEFKFEGNGGT